MISVSPLTGAASLVGSLGFNAANKGLAFRPNAVPEPAALAVFSLLGVIGLSSRRRTRITVTK